MAVLSRRKLFRGALVLAAPVASIALADPVLALIEKEAIAGKAAKDAMRALSVAERQMPKASRAYLVYSGRGGLNRFYTREQIAEYIRKFEIGPQTAAYLDVEFKKVEDAREAYRVLGLPALEEASTRACDGHFWLQSEVLETAPVTMRGMLALVEFVHTLAEDYLGDDRIVTGLTTIKTAAKRLLTN